MLSGDKAHELFMSPEPFPLLQFLDDWKEGKVKGEAGYILAVIGAYRTMCENSFDGRYNHVHRRMPF